MDNEKVTFKYYFDEDYDPEYVNGAFGGQTPNGELIINFFMDRFPIPYEVTQCFTEEDVLDENNMEIIPKPGDSKIRRVVKTGVVMSPNTAISVFQWLKLRLKEMGFQDDEL